MIKKQAKNLALLSVPKTTPDFYQFAVHIVYTIVLATSFDLLPTIMISISSINPARDPARFANFATLLMVYIIIISGWIGYTGSLSRGDTKEDTVMLGL